MLKKGVGIFPTPFFKKVLDKQMFIMLKWGIMVKSVFLWSKMLCLVGLLT
jgi:hypothetical protein